MEGTSSKKEKKAKKALEVLEDSPYKEMLVELAKKAANRSK